MLNLTGTTEGLFIGNLWVSREDWHWFAFHPYSGFEFKEVEPGVYEHWIHRNEHWEAFQGIFHTSVHKNSINLKDLYVRHPTNPYLYAHHGRNDNIIVLSNGYKIQPLNMEAIITTHIAVKGCLIVGTGHSQAALLIELNNPAIGNDASADESILELTIDGRPFFSGVPDSYMGYMLVVNRLSISIDTLCSDSTSIGRIALLIRQAAPRVTSQVVHESYALLERVEDYTQLRYAFMKLHGFDLMITNMMLFPASAVTFGDNLFANEAGVPDVIRPLLGGFNKAFRMCIILPMRDDGGVDLQLGLFPEEFEMISQDKEFARYATFLG